MSELPQGWADAKLGDVCLVFESRDPGWNPDAEFTYVDIGAIDNKTQTISAPKRMLGADAPSRARRVIKADDVLFSTVRTYLKNIAIVPQDLDGAFTSTGVAVLRAGDGVEPRYLFNWVTSDEFITQISKSQDGTLYPAVTDKDVFEAGIRLAPVPEQRRIVAKVDGLTARTARARKELDRIPTLIARYKQRLLALAFSGELTAGWRKENDASSAHMMPLKRLCRTITDGDHQAPPRADEGVPFITISAMNDGNIDLAKASRFVPKSYYDDLKESRQAQVGDVLFSVTGSIGIPALVTDGSPFVFQRHIAILKPDPQHTTGQFLRFMLESPEIKAQCLAVATGTAQLTVPLNGLRNFTIPLPTKAEQAEIVRRIKSAFGWLDRMAAEHAAAARLLPKLDAAILAKAFRGELVPQDRSDEPASVLLEQLELRRQSLGDAAKGRRGRKPKGSKVQSMTKKPLAARDRLLKDSEKWPAVGLPFEAIAMRNAMSHDALRDALFELLSGPAPALQQRFDADAEVIVIQRVAA